MSTTATRKRCRKCDEKFAGNGNWCKGCRAEQSKRMKAVAESQADDYEPTMEELDAMIEEQMRNLPPWWNHGRRLE